MSKSKHSEYQILPDWIEDELGVTFTPPISRYEKERFQFISANIDLTNRSVLDIGGNTGYFVFESLKSGAKHATLVEGNVEHCDFVSDLSVFLGYERKVTVQQKYYDFINLDQNKFNIIFLLNVLHHVGDDFEGGRDMDPKIRIVQILNDMSFLTEYMVFQIGFNLHGDINKPIYNNGTKEEMINHLRDGIETCWDIESIGIAEGSKEHAIYKTLSGKNIQRDDSLGEFLNRPLFILKSKNHQNEG